MKAIGYWRLEMLRDKLRRLKLMVKGLLYPGPAPAIRARAAYARNVFSRGSNLTSLDAGCGNGFFTILAAELGGQAIGIDSSRSNIRKCTEMAQQKGVSGRVSFQRMDMWHLADWGKRQFDQAILFEVLEHLVDDLGVLRIMWSILRPGGILHVSVPNSRRGWFSTGRLTSEASGGHVRWGYAFRELEALLGRAGFRVLEKRSVGGRGTMAGELLQRALAKLGLPVQVCYAVLTRPIVACLDAIPCGEKMTLCIRAQKPDA